MTRSYADWYASRPLRWRLWNGLRWRLSHMRCALFGGLSHGEELLLLFLRREEKKVAVLEGHAAMRMARDADPEPAGTEG